MRAARASGLLLLALFSGGCLVLSLQPAYDAESVVFDEALLGQWDDPDAGDLVTIERGEWRSYRIAVTDRSATHTYQANLTRIGSATFLDVTEMRGADPGPFLLPVHGVARIVIRPETLDRRGARLRLVHARDEAKIARNRCRGR